ncbi:MAG: hypothetical protein HN726_04590, partial [Candidatus Magasanikbacteria bacterium]|nr:hypothetical protein [Candidatus Magasanikbacteria bacterium]
THIDNNLPPVASLTPIAGEQTGDINFEFGSSDVEGDEVSIAGEYSTNEGLSWNSAILDNIEFESWMEGDFSLSFDGVDDYVNIGRPISTENGDYASISAWFKTNTSTFNDGYGAIVTNDTEPTNPEFRIMVINGGYVQLSGGPSSVSGPNIITANTYNDNNWHHVIGTKYGSNCVGLYIDGDYIGNDCSGSGDMDAGNNYFIGSGRVNGNGAFNGIIDDVAIWNEALTSSEITALYNSGDGLNPSSNSGDYSSSSNLQAYWNFNDGEGSTLTDLSGNDNHGTITGATWSTDVPASGPTEVSGVISSNTTWRAASSPYIATGNILVSEGVTLTIEAGVEVKFNYDKSLLINGELIAQGTNGNEITFTSNESSPAAGDWENIVFSSSSISATTDGDGNYLSGTILEYCTIEYGGDDEYGVIKLIGAPNLVSPMINNCTIKNNSGSGIYLAFSSPIISNCTIKGNDNGISIQDFNSSPNIKENIIKNNTNTGIIIGTWAKNVNVEKNIIYGNGTGIDCTVWSSNGTASIKSNSIIGNSNYGITIWTVTGSLEILNNIIADNVNRGVTFNPWNRMTIPIYDNHLINNGKNETTSFYQAFTQGEQAGGSLFKRNTFSSNNSSSQVLLIEDAEGTEIENCNFINNGAPILLKNDNASGSTINVENNYWGTSTDSEIQSLIYDWNDDASLGFADYDPYLSTPNTDAPISPPANVAKQISGSDVVLTWGANPESDVAGYKIHYGNFTGYSYTT